MRIEEKLLYLHANLRQIDFHGELLPGIDVWIMRFFESSFQLVKLIGGKSRSIPTMFFLGTIRILKFQTIHFQDVLYMANFAWGRLKQEVKTRFS